MTDYKTNLAVKLYFDMLLDFAIPEDLVRLSYTKDDTMYIITHEGVCYSKPFSDVKEQTVLQGERSASIGEGEERLVSPNVGDDSGGTPYQAVCGLGRFNRSFGFRDASTRCAPFIGSIAPLWST